MSILMTMKISDLNKPRAADGKYHVVLLLQIIDLIKQPTSTGQLQYLRLLQSFNEPPGSSEGKEVDIPAKTDGYIVGVLYDQIYSKISALHTVSYPGLDECTEESDQNRDSNEEK